jgi:hypothetical protein
MHRADVLIIGPLEPLLPRPLRVRLELVVASAASLACAGLLAALLVFVDLVSLPVWLAHDLARIVLAGRRSTRLPASGRSGLRAPPTARGSFSAVASSASHLGR